MIKALTSQTSSGMNMIIEKDITQLIIVNNTTANGVLALSAYCPTKKRVTMKITTASTEGIHISVRIS